MNICPRNYSSIDHRLKMSKITIEMTTVITPITVNYLTDKSVNGFRTIFGNFQFLVNSMVIVWLFPVLFLVNFWTGYPKLTTDENQFKKHSLITFYTEWSAWVNEIRRAGWLARRNSWKFLKILEDSCIFMHIKK